MGIKGLHKALEEYSTEGHVKDFAGNRVAVDGYAWLHKVVKSSVLFAYIMERDKERGRGTVICERLRLHGVLDPPFLLIPFSSRRRMAAALNSLLDNQLQSEPPQ